MIINNKNKNIEKLYGNKKKKTYNFAIIIEMYDDPQHNTTQQQLQHLMIEHIGRMIVFKFLLLLIF